MVFGWANGMTRRPAGGWCVWIQPWPRLLKPRLLVIKDLLQSLVPEHYKQCLEREIIQFLPLCLSCRSLDLRFPIFHNVLCLHWDLQPAEVVLIKVIDWFSSSVPPGKSEQKSSRQSCCCQVHKIANRRLANLDLPFTSFSDVCLSWCSILLCLFFWVQKTELSPPYRHRRDLGHFTTTSDVHWPQSRSVKQNPFYSICSSLA
jgi:hypothetical protein